MPKGMHRSPRQDSAHRWSVNSSAAIIEEARLARGKSWPYSTKTIGLEATIKAIPLSFRPSTEACLRVVIDGVQLINQLLGGLTRGRPDLAAAVEAAGRAGHNLHVVILAPPPLYLAHLGTARSSFVHIMQCIRKCSLHTYKDTCTHQMRPYNITIMKNSGQSRTSGTLGAKNVLGMCNDLTAFLQSTFQGHPRRVVPCPLHSLIGADTQH